MDTRNRQKQEGGRSRWFEGRRDHFLCQVVMDFFSFVQAFTRLYEEYLACGRLESGRLRMDLLATRTGENRQRIWEQLARMIGSETGKGELWQLKDLCHQIWPGQDRAGSVHGSLLDWLVGSVFHEAMKLKENIYLLNTYGPAARRLRRLSPQDTALPRLSAMVDVESLVGSIADDAARQVEHLAVLVGQATCILRILLPELAGNPLLVRLLIEEEDQVRTVWGEEIDSVLADMFQGSSARGFCAAGRSYLEGQWYERARAMYDRALQSDPDNREARRQLVRLQSVPEGERPGNGGPEVPADGQGNVEEPSII
jgi:hypothetical protein